MRGARLLPLAVAAATFCAFLPALGGGFVGWDDLVYFIDNPRFAAAGPADLPWLLTNIHLGHHQPVTWLSWGLDRLVWGLRPAGYHLTNILLHCANAVLLCLMARRLLERTLADASLAPWAAGLAAALFSLHPLRAEAVAWVSERREVLGAFFYLATVALYLDLHRPRETKPPHRVWAWGACLLALLANVRAVSLPAVLLILDAYPLARFSGPRGWRERGVWLEKAPYAVMALAAGVVGMAAQASQGGLVPLSNAGLSSRLEQACFGVGFYLWKTAAPLGLSNWYGLSYLDARRWLCVVGGLAVVCLTGALWRARRRHPAGLAAWCWYLAALFPSLGIVKSGHQMVADRYAYVPLMASAVLAAAWAAGFWGSAGRRRRVLMAVAAAAGLAAMAGLTWRQCRVWHDSVALWSQALRVDPRSVFARTGLAAAFLRAKDYGGALRAIDSARGAVLAGGDPDVGPWLLPALTKMRAMTFCNWGVDLAYAGRSEEAMGHLRKALAVFPGVEGAHTNLGLLLYRAGRASEAVEHFEAAVRADPGSADSRVELASALAKSGRLDEAVVEFRRALAMAPGDRTAAEGLSQALRLKKAARR
ncbi:MAG: tetratricopeptide repeat protein [Elusimicrobia bacterium]|nr:tetratricopeptide repeat protein [Elusimicrobiota bacterium]